MKPTIQAVIEALNAPVETPPAQTVDTLQFGHPDTEVTGIATCFMPTRSVLEQAAALGANMVVAHEGAFYSHHDLGEGSYTDAVIEGKGQLIRDLGIALYRFHDHIHRYRPDGIMQGLLRELGWEAYAETHRPEASILRLPPLKLNELVRHVKERLELSSVEVMGDPELVCSRVGILAGYRGGGGTAIPLFERDGVDVVLYGEGPEWETPEYVRDALHEGRRKGLIVLGHGASEEPGMKGVADQLRARFPEVPVHYLKEKALFRRL